MDDERKPEAPATDGGAVIETDETRLRDAAEECLTRLLRTFFPSHVGAGSQHQARGYIRVSAIGRGTHPAGSPEARQLIAALEAVGFSRRVHREHLQTPWGSRGGRRYVEIRNELSAYLRDGTRGPNVRALLDRIRREARWTNEPNNKETSV